MRQPSLVCWKPQPVCHAWVFHLVEGRAERVPRAGKFRNAVLQFNIYTRRNWHAYGGTRKSPLNTSISQSFARRVSTTRPGRCQMSNLEGWIATNSPVRVSTIWTISMVRLFGWGCPKKCAHMSQHGTSPSSAASWRLFSLCFVFIWSSVFDCAVCLLWLFLFMLPFFHVDDAAAYSTKLILPMAFEAKHQQIMPGIKRLCYTCYVTKMILSQNASAQSLSSLNTRQMK